MFGTDFLLCHHFYDLPLLDDILTKGVHSLCLGLEQRLANPEYCGLLYMPSHYSWMACEDLFARRQFMSTSWLYPRLMLDSLSFSTLAITMIDCLLQGFVGGRWSFCRGKSFPKPIITQRCLTEAHLYPIINSGCLSTWWLCAYLLVQLVPLRHIPVPTNLAPHCQSGSQATSFSVVMSILSIIKLFSSCVYLLCILFIHLCKNVPVCPLRALNW